MEGEVGENLCLLSVSFGASTRHWNWSGNLQIPGWDTKKSVELPQ